MQVSVTFRHMEASEAVKEYARAKISKINKYLYHPAEVDIVLEREKHRVIAEITLVSQRGSLKGQEETEDVYSAIDLVVDKVERQLVKRKEKMKRHKSGPGDGDLGASGEPAPEAEVGEMPRIVETKSFSVKPMSLDEATMQMRLSGEEVFVFTNASSGEVNVLYEVENGGYGMIIPGRE
ncbi:MAG: ribosome-associated translation inhibitor RaiA [bacterium]